ncbi:hypothetical protein BC567DRAFT_7757 [Phyllosticta citribraziliensis]
MIEPSRKDSSAQTFPKQVTMIKKWHQGASKPWENSMRHSVACNIDSISNNLPRPFPQCLTGSLDMINTKTPSDRHLAHSTAGTQSSSLTSALMMIGSFLSASTQPNSSVRRGKFTPKACSMLQLELLCVPNSVGCYSTSKLPNCIAFHGPSPRSTRSPFLNKP